MSNYNKCLERLVELSTLQGYLTYDDIINESAALPVSEVDNLSEAIQLRGIIVYEKGPQIEQSPGDDENVQDYSRTDYAAIYEEILDLAPRLKPLIMLIQTFRAPQWGEVDQLVRQKAEGNQSARETLIKLYMRSALKIALSMTKLYELDIEDAVSAGFIGLIRAVDHYDPSGFSAFHSYAALWIKQGIQRWCVPVWMDYYFPSHYKDKMYRSILKYNQYCAGKYEASQDLKLLVRRIAQETDLPEDDVDEDLARYFTQKYGKLSLETIAEFELSHKRHDIPELVISDEIYLESIYLKDLKLKIAELLSSLPEREAQVIRMRNGIDYPSPMTLEEIGTLLAVTRERVRQIEKNGLRKLIQICYKKKLFGYEQETIEK
jgi:RNA polymerase primary sigma factor